jgi:hypothetical protein
VNGRPGGIVAALLVALGLVAAGWLVGDGFRDGRAADRFVTVKGISERTVKADLALWPMRFAASGNDLGAVQAEIVRDAQTILDFLAEAGIPREQIELQSLEVTDRQAVAYGPQEYEDRFVVTQTLLARTEEVDTMVAASQRVGTLVEAGVLLSSDYGPQGSGPIYLFSELTELKPEMIAEATENAREAAEQFALDSGSRLGGIRQANQGVFQILPRDNAPGLAEEKQVYKTVRVVSTIDYRLVD